MTQQAWGINNDGLYASPADWISPGQITGFESASDPFTSNPPVLTTAKVSIIDTDHTGWGIYIDNPTFSRAWVWNSFTRGHNTILMEDLKGNSGWIAARKAMGHTRSYANKMNLVAMTPQNSLSSTAHVLASAGKEYLVYQGASGAFTVNLVAGTYSFEWFNPATGAVAGTGSVTAAAGNKSFTPPFTGPAVLYLKSGGATIVDKTVPSVPTNLNGTATSSSVNLTWSASTDNAGGSGVAGYKVYRNGVLAATVTGTSASITGLAANTSYNFTVASFDNAGNNSAQGAIKTVTTLNGTTITCPTRANANIYVAANDFSGIQNCNQWSYRDSKGANLTYNSTAKQWKGSETYLTIANTTVHPGNNADVVRRWTAPAAGSIRIAGNAVDNGGVGSGSDGVNVSIKKGTTTLWQSNLVNGSTTPVAYNVTTPVTAGQTIDFVVNKLTNNSYDSTSFNPTITFTAGGTTTTNLPDVVVTNITYSAGKITATVKNQGTATTPTGVVVGVGYFVDGVYRTYGAINTPIAAGASVNIGTNGSPYIIPKGTHTILANVDDAKRFTESNENNNVLSKSFVIP